MDFFIDIVIWFDIGNWGWDTQSLYLSESEDGVTSDILRIVGKISRKIEKKERKRRKSQPYNAGNWWWCIIWNSIFVLFNLIDLSF